MTGLHPGRSEVSRDDYNTDPAIIAALCEALNIGQFDFDACADARSSKAPLYTHDLEDFLDNDEFANHPEIKYVWANPPFNLKNVLIPKLFAACEVHGIKLVCLLPCAPETKFWRNTVWPQSVIFPSNRIKFVDPDTGKYVKDSAKFVSVLVAINLTLTELEAVHHELQANKTVVGASLYAKLREGYDDEQTN